MRKLMSRAVMATVVMAALLFAAVGEVRAQGQPNSVNPTASSVKEQQLLDALKPSPGTTSAVTGRVSIPDRSSGNLIQPAGRDWQNFHRNTVPMVAGVGILGIMLLIAVFYLVRGEVKIDGGRSGTLVTRFNGLERFTHWLTATSFIMLALSGLNISVGRYVLLPVIGPEAFTALSAAGKLVHNYVGFAFIVGIVLMFLIWVKDNIPHPRDVLWLLKGGGLIGHWKVPAGRFNGGQKLIFWSVVIGGSLLALSGLIKLFPFQVTDIAGMQLANIVHALGGIVLTAIIIAHIYIGSLGMEGAFEAMGSGEVDLNWAKEHHSVWVDRMSGDTKSKIAPAE